MDVVQVTVSVPSREVGAEIARSVVNRRLAACVQVLGPMTSTYRWQGKVETAEEWIVLLKTTADRAGDLVAHIREVHPYDVPEVIVTAVVAGNPDYLAWVAAETAP
ncbi:MAG: divalent-cation tolerance protein CutA [Actinobacteria bacterium]|nr:divalent-cation tolerance protein CutA [Actinomycetota bacterium]